MTTDDKKKNRVTRIVGIFLFSSIVAVPLALGVTKLLQTLAPPPDLVSLNIHNSANSLNAIREDSNTIPTPIPPATDHIETHLEVVAHSNSNKGASSKEKAADKAAADKAAADKAAADKAAADKAAADKAAADKTAADKAAADKAAADKAAADKAAADKAAADKAAADKAAADKMVMKISGKILLMDQTKIRNQPSNDVASKILFTVKKSATGEIIETPKVEDEVVLPSGKHVKDYWYKVKIDNKNIVGYAFGLYLVEN
jgi:hypothetical protein